LIWPDPDTNNAFIYCLAEAASRYGIGVIFTLAMSNHHHTGIYDPEGTYPAFLEHFHKLFAKCQNALRRRWENFWSSEQTSVVRLVEAADVLDKMVYALTNPVKDRLVERARDWPGVSSLNAQLNGSTLSATRPKHFFRAKGSMPESVELRLIKRPGFEHLSHEDLAKAILERVRDIENTTAAERRRTGTTVVGAKRVLAQPWNGRP
jgi:putative transposase